MESAPNGNVRRQIQTVLMFSFSPITAELKNWLEHFFQKLMALWDTFFEPKLKKLREGETSNKMFKEILLFIRLHKNFICDAELMRTTKRIKQTAQKSALALKQNGPQRNFVNFAQTKINC